MNDWTSVLKDRAILSGWIAGLVLAAALLWFLTFPFRSACLMNSTNKALAAMDDTRRLSSPYLHYKAGPGLRFADPLGCWYHLSDSADGSLFYVFVIMREGILVPCGAEISGRGELIEIVPLSSHAQQIIGQIPAGMMQVYLRRLRIVSAAIAASLPPESGRGDK